MESHLYRKQSVPTSDSGESILLLSPSLPLRLAVWLEIIIMRNPTFYLLKNSKVLLNIFPHYLCCSNFSLGAQADFSVVWNIADITMGVMAIINIIAIMLLRKTAIKALKSYEEQKKAGKNPVFKESDIGIKDTVWKEEFVLVKRKIVCRASKPAYRFSF